MVPERWRNKISWLKTETYALFLAYKDPRVPLLAKIIVAIAVAYALSPIDLIPDFIPVIGYLDDVFLVPLLISIAVKLIPEDVLGEYREKSKVYFQGSKPKSYIAAIVVVLIWIVVLLLVIKLLFL